MNIVVGVVIVTMLVGDHLRNVDPYVGPTPCDRNVYSSCQEFFFALYALYPANVVISYIACYCVLRRCLSLDDLNVITVHDRKCLAAFRSMRID